MPPDEIDRRIGRNIRRLRKARRLSQTRLGMALGVTFQQIQKYESGANRISASALFRLAQALSEPIRGFFDEAA